MEATKQAKADLGAKTLADEEAYLIRVRRVIDQGAVLFDMMKEGLENLEKFDDTQWFLTLAILREGLANEVDTVQNQPPPTTRLRRYHSLISQFGDALNNWKLLVMQAHELNDANRLTQAGVELDGVVSTSEQLVNERKKLDIEP